MTYKKAKALMEIELKCVNGNEGGRYDRNCIKCDIVQEINELNEAYTISIEALNKQIPKKPDYIGDGYSDGQLVYDTFICPTCGTHYEVDYDDYMYCPKCGQRLDLTEV